MRGIKRVTSLLVPIIAFVSFPCYGAVFFNASAFSSLEITGIAGGDISDLLIEGCASRSVFEVTGSASASAAVDPDVPTPLTIGGTVEQSASTSGTATSPPVSSASGEVRTDGWVTLENTSLSDTFIVSFALDWNYLVDTTVSDPVWESAFADAAIDVSVSGVSFFSVFDFSDTNSKPESFSDNGMFFFDVTLLAGGSDKVTVFTDATGFAESNVPEPASAVVWFVIGMFGIGAVRRRSHPPSENARSHRRRPR